MAEKKTEEVVTVTKTFGEMLREDNWPKFLKAVREYNVRSEVLWPALKTGRPPLFRCPEMDDLIFRPSLNSPQQVTISEVDFMNKVQRELEAKGYDTELIMRADGDPRLNDPEDVVKCRQDMERIREPYRLAYDGVAGQALYVEDIKDYRRLQRVYATEKNEFLAVLLSSMSAEAKNILESEPSYEKAFEDKDVFEIWRLLEMKFGAKGKYMKAVLAVKLFKLRQDKNMSLDEYIIEFRRLMRDLDDKAPDSWMASVIFLVGIDSGPFIVIIREIMSTDPLPTVDEIILKLNKQRNSDKAIKDGRSDVPTSAKALRDQDKISEDAVAIVNKAEVNTGRSKIQCNNCDEFGHIKSDCPYASSSCQVEGCKSSYGHCTAAHSRVMKYEAKKAKKAQPMAKVNFINVDDEFYH